MFADHMLATIEARGNPCVIGLDPRIELMPDFVTRRAQTSNDVDEVGKAISAFHERVIGLIAKSVPAVKLQIAFYEQYGLPGMRAFVDTIQIARAAGLVVIVDAKRNDIDSTAQAYANAFLGGTSVFGHRLPAFDVDCITVSPFLGRDSVEPFVKACAENGRGIFVLVKTSNPGSGDIQDRVTETGNTISTHLAGLVAEWGQTLVGDSGYSSIGAVVGATFPAEAAMLRTLMPKAIILVPGYGAQGGTAESAAVNFNADGLGAVVNASRSVTYNFGELGLSADDFDESVRRSVSEMAASLNVAISSRTSASA
jgi:orotidine-5'-phosphate decarboxylase